jgi:ribose 5-phosphate isomerase B
MERRIFIGSDHAGFGLKEEVKKHLSREGYTIGDIGPSAYDKDDDYPDYAVKVCRKVLSKKGEGILICGSGLGMDRAANKVRGIRASVCWDIRSARNSREHGDANVLCLGSKFVSRDKALRIVDAWLDTPFSGEERHLRRIRKTMQIERGR